MNAIAIRDDINLEQLQTLGQIFVKSRFFTDAQDAAQAIVKIMAGRELGFPDIASMTGVYVIKGKVSLSANLMAAAIKKSVKYNYRIRQHDDQGCKIEFFEDGESVGFSEFTRKDAEKAGLLGSDTWKKFFRNMCFARALSNGAKWHCPDIFSGPIYTPEEMGAMVNEEGEVIDLPVEPTIEPEPEPTPEAYPLTQVDTIAELRLLNDKLGYDDDKLLKWVTKKFKLDKGLTLNVALFSLGEGELQEAIEIFERHIEAARQEAA